MSGVRIGAVDLAEAIGLPRPTDEQAAVIESPMEPALVVAGAGSGKTETMASRVLWLLANGHVGVPGILGLTFTRKAAGELGKRIAERIRQLEAAGLLPGEFDPFDAPTITTYNAFANTVFRDNALLVGREAEATVLGEPSAWQLARALVSRSDDARLSELGKSPDAITQAVLDLGRAMGEHVADPAAVRAEAERFAGLLELPAGKRTPYASVLAAVESVSALPPLVDLAVAFAELKEQRGLVEFSDQVALALQVVEGSPQVATDLRERYPVVLLDEYQDTSVVQTRLLAGLFRGAAVMGVGDPHQSIYGFRGASAANLGRFLVDFAAPAAEPGAGAGPVGRYALATSWRNAETVLAAADTLVDPLSRASAVPVERLRPRPGAPAGTIELAYPETLPEEADAVAGWFAAALRSARSTGQEPPTAAILFRSRKTMPSFANALEAAGVPYRILGLGGLLSQPEIVDLVSCLRVLHDPQAGSALIRLLAGARWRIGLADIAQLREVARWLFDRDHALGRLDDEVRRKLRSSVAAGEDGSLVDALDFVATANEEHGRLAAFSPDGLRRMRSLGRELTGLRRHGGLDLGELVALVQQQLRLDLEVTANDRNRLGSAYLHAFAEEVAGYAAAEEQATLGGLLGWLDAAARRDDLGPRQEEAERGTVQLLTVHGSKGLEWDLVAVPRLVEGEFPGSFREGRGWTAFGQLPFPFRGDAAELPELAWQGCETQQEVDEQLTRFKDALGTRHHAEERRLVYVALTRARGALLLSGSFWAGQTKPRDPSVYLRELEAGGAIPALPEGTALEGDPLDEAKRSLAWPFDPLGDRRPRVETAAAAVRAALAADPVATDWDAEIDLLLAERERMRAGGDAPSLPTRVPASRFKDYVSDPDAVAAELRRPMPQRPYKATRLGTLFHRWVEQRSGLVGLGESIDGIASERDDELEHGPEAAALARFQQTFERSPWAGLAPSEVEVEVHLPFDGRLVICKLDAVYTGDDGRIQIVDWKTGPSPKDDAELELRQLQLALYRLAYARWKGLDPAIVDAVFYYVGEDRILRPERLDDEAALLVRWRAAVPRA